MRRNEDVAESSASVTDDTSSASSVVNTMVTVMPMPLQRPMPMPMPVSGHSQDQAQVQARSPEARPATACSGGGGASRHEAVDNDVAMQPPTKLAEQPATASMPNGTRKKKKTPRVFACDTCGKSFNRRSHLSSHQRTHSGDKPYECHVCSKRFTQSGSLNRHMRSHNPNPSEPPHPCNVCGKRFASKKGLAGHKRGSHPGAVGSCQKMVLASKPKQINHSQKSTIQQQQKQGPGKHISSVPASNVPLNMNMMTVTTVGAPASNGPHGGAGHGHGVEMESMAVPSLLPPPPPPVGPGLHPGLSIAARRLPGFECPVCFKVLPSAESLDKHVRMHSTPAPELDFSFFDEKLPWLDELPLPSLPRSPPVSPMFDHGRVVQAQQPLECMLCWQSFSHCNHLNQHLFTTHFKTPPTSPKKTSLPQALH